MDMFDENVVLCVSNSYEKKYYFNPDFDKLPDDVKNELKIMCVLFTEEVGGIWNSMRRAIFCSNHQQTRVIYCMTR